ncbi:MAG: histidine phosphatase family protein [Eubacteriales bacterium]|nr:histidine phosphatase family protein [Eubacteriales bacterium]
MKIYLLRHGLTAYNEEKRYQGRTDVPLSPRGLAQLRRADISPERVYVTGLRRTAQTAAVLFPEAEQVVERDLGEMDFGIFEGKNYLEMEHDPAYRAWVDANCETVCPGGEGKQGFSRRVCAAFARLVEENLAAGTEILAIVAHGGTQMAVMEAYGLPRRDYYSWRAPNAGGFVLDTAPWPRGLRLLDTVQYTEEEPR